jgi:hypothetical protein
VQLYKDGAALDSNTLSAKQWGNVNSYHFHAPSSNFLVQAPLSATTVFSYKFRKNTCPTSLKVFSKYAKKITIKLNKEAIED